MALSSQTKTILIIAIVLIIIYFIYRLTLNSAPQAEGFNQKHCDPDNSIPENMEEKDGEEEEAEEAEEEESENGEEEESVNCDAYPHRGSGYSPEEASWLEKKFNSKNKVKRGYKKVSYSGSRRGNQGPSEWDSYFDANNNILADSQGCVKFTPMDETNGQFAVFKSQGREKCGSNQDCDPEDLFDLDKLLPQEVNDNWFDVVPEPISVKNRHLINITKPIGVNTVGSSKKNASHDLRGNPPNPKFIISPFLNSTIEPDINVRYNFT